MTDQRQTPPALMDHDHRFRDVFEQAAIGLAQVAPDGSWLYFNDRLCAILGFSRDQLVHRTWQSMTPSTDLGLEEAYMEQLALGTRDNYAIEKHFVCGDSSVPWFLATVSAVRRHDGVPEYFVMVVQSIDERKQAEDERMHGLVREQQARVEAEEAVRMRDDLLFGISHDLKNPLSTIKGQAQLLQRRVEQVPDDIAAPLKRGAAGIEAAAMRMNRMIDDMVDTAYLRIGRPLKLHAKPTDLCALTQRVVQDYAALRPTNDITTSVLCSTNRIEVVVDEARIERVILSALSNAVRFSRAGGSVQLNLGLENGYAVLRVIDHGIGIPAVDLPFIFERFYRGANVLGNIEGEGIGLSGAKQIAEQHHGTLSVTSREGEGSTFILRLPVELPAG